MRLAISIAIACAIALTGCAHTPNEAVRQQRPDRILRGPGQVIPFMNCMQRSYVDRVARYHEVQVSLTWSDRQESGELIARTPSEILVMVTAREDASGIITAEIREGAAWAFKESDADRAADAARACLDRADA